MGRGHVLTQKSKAIQVCRIVKIVTCCLNHTSQAYWHQTHRANSDALRYSCLQVLQRCKSHSVDGACSVLQTGKSSSVKVFRICHRDVIGSVVVLGFADRWQNETTPSRASTSMSRSVRADQICNIHPKLQTGPFT